MPDTWITLTEENVLTKIAGFELTIVKSILLAPGQENPLPEIVTSVVADVRNAIAQNPLNILGEGETIPLSASRHALAIIRVELATRVPKLATKLLDSVRLEQAKTAEQWLRSKPRVVTPGAPAPEAEQIGGTGVQEIRGQDRENFGGLI